MMGGMMDGMMGGGMGFGMIFGWLFWLLILAVVVYALLGFVRQAGSQASGSSTQAGETPLAILKRRYAAGEIDQAQYEAMKGQLS